MPPCWIFSFQNFIFLTVGRVKRANVRHGVKFCGEWGSVKPLVRHGDISIFQDGGCRALGFAQCGNFRGGKGRSRGSKCVTKLNFAEIGQNAAEIPCYTVRCVHGSGSVSALLSDDQDLSRGYNDASFTSPQLNLTELI